MMCLFHYNITIRNKEKKSYTYNFKRTRSIRIVYNWCTFLLIIYKHGNPFEIVNNKGSYLIIIFKS